VIPIDRTQAGLPIEMQIIGKRWREMELLSLAVAERLPVVPTAGVSVKAIADRR
jgi:hypothetical protein